MCQTWCRLTTKCLNWWMNFQYHNIYSPSHVVNLQLQSMAGHHVRLAETMNLGRFCALIKVYNVIQFDSILILENISHRLDFLNKFAACAKMVIKPNISGAVCHLKEDCTSLECCVGVEYLTRNIKSFLTIDPCTSELQVGIGKFSRNISLAHYRWGTVELLNNWFA